MIKQYQDATTRLNEKQTRALSFGLLSIGLLG